MLIGDLQWVVDTHPSDSRATVLLWQQMLLSYRCQYGRWRISEVFAQPRCEHDVFFTSVPDMWGFCTLSRALGVVRFTSRVLFFDSGIERRAKTSATIAWLYRQGCDLLTVSWAFFALCAIWSGWASSFRLDGLRLRWTRGFVECTYRYSVTVVLALNLPGFEQYGRRFSVIQCDDSMCDESRLICIKRPGVMFLQPQRWGNCNIVGGNAYYLSQRCWR